MDIDKINKCLENINKLINYKKILLDKYKGSRATLYIQSEINALNEYSTLLYSIAKELRDIKVAVRELRNENQNLREELELNERVYETVSELYYKSIKI